MYANVSIMLSATRNQGVVKERKISPQINDVRWRNKMPGSKHTSTSRKENVSETYSTFEREHYLDLDTTIHISDAIETIGFGPFQVFFGLVAGIAWIADGMEIMVISILGPVLKCEWNIDVYQEAMLTTVVFFGILIGSPAIGWFADNFGRRHALVLSTLWISVYGLLSALAPRLYWLYFLRFLVGIGVAGSPQVVTYFAELLPNKYRGCCLILSALFFSIGGLLTTVLAIFILIPFGWRWWLAACSVPSMIYVGLCVVLGYCLEWMPRSPYFDIIANNSINAEKTLKLIAHCNNRKGLEGTLVAEPCVPKGRICDLWRPGFKITSVLLTTLWFLTGFSYYGMVLFTAEVLALGSTCGTDALMDTDNLTCQVPQRADYIDMMVTSTAELPGLVITAILVDKIGRKTTLIIENIIYGIACLFLFACMGGNMTIFFIFILRFIGLSSFETLVVYTPEFYPTEVRALSIGMGSMFCRFSTMLSPYVSEVLVSKSLDYGIGIYAGIAFLFSLVASLLPFETKGKHLSAHG